MQTTEFKIKLTSIPGLLLIDISLIEDDRGSFQEKFQRAKLVELGLPANFVPVQHNISYNRQAGITRGIHAEPWDKYISVIKGRVFAAFVDLRMGNNFSKVVTVELDQTKAVFVPRGVANSFQTLEPDTYYSYMVNDHWSANKQYLSVNQGDPDLAIAWPISLDKAIVSERDQANPMLKDIKPFSV